MSSTLRLLRVIGSPFTQSRELPQSRNNALELYNYAVKNKIGLLYLETLNDRGKLKDFGLESTYRDEHKKYQEQLITLRRIAKILNSLSINYAVFKSIMPFPAVPNDVDILCFETDERYKEIVNILLENGYLKTERGSGPHVVMFHDMRNPEHDYIRGKDIYDIDLYKDVAISHVVYLDKRKLAKYVTEIDVLGEQIKVLKPEAELVASVTHSIIPEQLCTLFVYYATLFYFEKMKSEDVKQLINIAKENNVTFPIRTHCSLVAELHQVVYGFVPQKIEEILTNLGDERRERNSLIKNNFKMPHRYSWATVIRTLLEMMKGGEFRRSMIAQTIYMMNPKFAKYVISQLIWRRERETY